MTWVLLHSLILLARTPTFDWVYQIRYGFVVISITRSGGVDDKSWISRQNSHYYLVAGRFDPFFRARILHYTHPPPHTLCGVLVWSKMMKICTFYYDRIFGKNTTIQYAKIVCHSYRYTTNILTTLVTPCKVWNM